MEPQLSTLDAGPSACPCDVLQATADVTIRGRFRLARNVRLTCQKCGAVFETHAVASDQTLLMEVKPSPARRRTAARKPKSPTAEETQAREVFDRLAGEWRRSGGTVPPTIGWQALAGPAHLSAGVQLLALGTDAGLVGLALDQTQAAGPHAVVADPETRGRLAPLVTRCAVHAEDWRPPYGTLYHGIVLAGDVGPEWIERIPRLLQPAGDCWLLGAAQRHESLLSAQWGYTAIVRAAGTPEEHRWFLGVLAPLPPGLPGTHLHDDLAKRGMPECQSCRRLAHQMNAWGAAVCRERIEAIVADILPRARDWWRNTDQREKLAAWWQGSDRLWSAVTTGVALATQDLDDLLRTVIRQRVTAAIDAADEG